MILDTDYITKDGKPIIRIFKKENGEFKVEYDRSFEPYFYALLKDDSAIEEVKKITASRHGTVVKVRRAEKVQKKFLGRPVEVWKLYFNHPQDVPAIRDKIRAHPEVIDIYEYDIPFAKRYLIDKGLIPMEGDEELKMLAFDIETLYHEGEEFGTGPILMISYADENEARVITWKKIDLPYVDVVSTEKEMIKRFLKVVKEKDPDVLITYNGDNFDFAYLKKRSEKLGVKFVLGRDGSEPKIQRMGDRLAVEVKGRIHFDLYPVIRRTINLPTYTLEAVYEAVFGKPKEKVYAEEIALAWESGEGLERVARYSMEDAKVTFELGREFFPMEAQLSRLVGQSLWDVSRSSTGNFVEWFLLRKAYERNELAPNKPDDRELARRRNSYAGGYVKEPERGLWGNIVYLDFRCHPADTKVLVKGRGIINISEVREGDYVLGIEGWQRVKKVWEYDYEGELINIKGLRCTPNHKLPIVGKNEGQTRIRDSLAKSFLTKKVKSRLITTPLFERIGRIVEENIPEEEVLKGELAGIILAEGTSLRKEVEYFDSPRGKGRVSHRYRVEITVGEHEGEFKRRILYIFEKLFGVTPRISRKKGTNAVTIKVAKKKVYLKAKELMENVENLNTPSVLRGFFESDGTVDRVRRMIVVNQGTNNKWKIEVISKLLEKLGIPHNRYTYEDIERGKNLTRYIIEITGRDGLILFQTLVGFISTEKNQALSDAIRGREMNRIEDNAFYSLSEFKATKEYYKGKVYDLTLEGTPYYFANGILTHNSLYPSIIITHNVSPDTLNREDCKEYDIAPQVGHRFCKDFPGFIPSLLGPLLEERQKIKRKMKATRDPIEKKLLDYRQRAIKILANSLLSEEWVPILENDKIKLVRIGEFVDSMMEADSGLVRRDGNTEVLEVEGIKALSFDRESKRAQVMPVKAVIRHIYSGDVYKVVLSSGRKIRITTGHSLFAYRNGELIEITGGEVKPGDLLAVPKRVNLPERKERLNIVELLLKLPESETEDIVMTIPVKGRKAFFRGMLRTLRWVFGKEKRPRTARRYLRHLARLGYVKLRKIGYDIIDREGLEGYMNLYEKLVQTVRYNGKGREYLVEFNAIRDVIHLMPEEELREWMIGTRNGFRMGQFMEVNEDFAKLLGYYVSEGYARKQKNQKNRWNYVVRLYNENQRVLDDMERLAGEFFGRTRRGENYVEIQRKMAYIIFEGLCGVLAENKRVPEVIFTSSENVRWAFLEGYFIGDGDVHPAKRVRLSTKSELLVNGLVLLLNSLGISAVKLRHDSGVYQVYVNEELPFTEYRKKKNVYHPHVIPKEVLEETFGKVFQKNVSHEKFRELVESGKLDEERAKRIEWLLNGDIVLDRVVEVKREHYEGYVYDLSVEGDENFLAGFGLLYAHNSYYGYYGYAKARWYCRECAESVTAWGREYIETTIREIEGKFGFKVLYADSITGDTEVIIRRNSRVEFTPIEKLFQRVDYRVGEKEYCVLEGVEALTLDNGGQLVWKKVPYVMRHRTNKRIYRIWFTNSWYLDVTEDHSLIGYLNTSRVKAGRPLKERFREVKPEEIGKEVKSLLTPNGVIAHSVKAVPIAVRLWELIGLLVGDDNWGRTSRWAEYYLGLSLGLDKKEIEDKILKPLKNAGIISNYYDKSKKGDISILSKWLARFMVKHFKDENGNKRIPDFMFNLPKEYIEAFLRGLFSADGTVSLRRGVPEVRLTSVNSQLSSSVRKLLWLVGVSNSMFTETKPNKYPGKGSGTQTVHVRIKDKHRFAQRIGFLLDRKATKLSENLRGHTSKKRAYKYDFDLVHPKKVEETCYDGYVYDIEVEGTHRFFANGILVHNTDGFFATILGADAETVKKKAKEFLKYINAKLPGLLELEYEGFYLRGFFVTKKKYAVIDEEGKIITRGLEIVRRDWSQIAKETQARVLEAILKHGDVEEAVRIVKEVTEKLSKYEVPPEKLVIHEQITRELKDYKAMGPHVAIAKRLAKQGIKIRPGTVISYIVLKGSGRIGNRAITFNEFNPTKHKYDAEYYIENQVLPAVERILRAFGYRKEDLRYQKTRQVGLGTWLRVKGKKNL